MPEQTTERYCVLVNGHAVEPGCWVDGHWGQYGPDHLADRASELGWEPETEMDDPRAIRRIIEQIETWGYPRDGTDMSSEAVGIIASFWEAHIESTDDIEQWLNDHTPPVHQGRRFVHPLVLEADGKDHTSGAKAMETEPTYATYSWGWHDGEFYLWPTETWEEEG